MPTHGKHQAVCVRPGCHKVPTRSIPTSLFTGRRAKVCKACYTWMRRHFQVEPNGKHVRCADLGVLDRCRDMLVDFAKAGVFPVETARRTPNLLLSPSSKYYCEASMPSGSLAFMDDHPTCPVAHKPPVSSSSSSSASRRSRRGRGSRRTTSAPRAIKRGTARTRAAAAHAMPAAALDADLSAASPPEAKLPAPVARLDDGLMRVGDSTPTLYHYSGSAALASGRSTPKHQCGWQDVGFDELSDTDMPQPPVVRRMSSVASTSSTMSDSDMAPHANPPAARGPWERGADEEDSQDVDFDELSTLSMHAWQALVDDSTPRSFPIDFDMDGEAPAWGDEDVNMAAAAATPGMHAGLAPAGMSSGLPAGLSAGLPSGLPSLHGVVTHFAPRSNSPSALLFPAGMPPSMAPTAPPPPPPLHPHQQHYVGSARTVPNLRCPPPYRRSSGGTPPVHMRGRRAFHVTGGASPDIKPELHLSRTYAQDVSVAACGATCPRPVERAVTPHFCPPLARVASNDSLFSCTVDGLEPADAVLPVVPDRRYGRRQASAGVGHAVAAITAASPTVC